MREYEKPLVAVAVALAALCGVPSDGAAQENADIAAPARQDDLESLFTELRAADEDSAQIIVQRITGIWSHSGSASIDLLLERGKQALEDSNYGVAVEHFGAAIDHAPDFAEAYNGRAAAFFQMQEFGLSVADIQQVLVLNPRHFGALEGLGKILLELGDLENALIAFREAQALNPQRHSLNESVLRLQKELEDAAL